MKTLSKVYIVLTLLLLADLILYLTSGISLASKLADQILFWAWFILTFIVIFGTIRKLATKIYGLVLIVLIVLSLLPMGVPFLTVVAFMIPNPSPEYLYHDKDYKVECTVKSVIGIPYISVVKNYLIFEKEIAELGSEFEIAGEYYGIEDIKSVYRQKSGNNAELILNLDFGFETIKKEIKN